MDTASWIPETPTKYKKISNTKIVLDTIEEAILSKKIKPGDAIPSESVLSSSLNVSKSSVREAVKMLEALGVVTVIQGKGSFICEGFNQASSNLMVFQLIVSERSPRELVEFRSFFEPMYMLLAMEKMTDEDHEILKNYIVDFEKKVNEKTLTSEDDIWFHEFLLNKTDNSIIINVGSMLNRIIKTRIEKGIKYQAALVLSDHKAICDALIKRDAALLTSCVRDSITN